MFVNVVGIGVMLGRDRWKVGSVVREERRGGLKCKGVSNDI